MKGTAPLLSVRSVRKSFGPVEVLHGVDFDVISGEVHVLAGENGAGKSTLVNILSGVHTDFSGDLALRGVPHRFAGPADAARAGVATIHQELSLVTSLSVADNLFLGRERTDRWGRVDFAAQEAEAARLLGEAGLSLAPRNLVAELAVSTRQMLEIVRALARDAAVFVLDEPTSALNEREAELLFSRIEVLRQNGCGIVYITHRMDEIYRLADRISVLRDGRMVRTVDAAELPPSKLIALMVGQDVTLGADPPPPPASSVRMDVRDLRVGHPTRRGRPLVDRVSFTLRAGEILGLAGLQGSGASDVLHALFGDPSGPVTGHVSLEGSEYRPRGPDEALRQGVALVTNDRKGQGLAPEQSVTHSVSLASLDRFTARGGWLRRAAERAAVSRVTKSLRLRAPGLEAPVRALSGGNQQKAYLARCLLTSPRVLLLDEPTRGIDIGAKTDIYALMRGWVSEGISILLITSELDELLLLCHRILVLKRGQVTAELNRGEASRERILAAAMGAASASARLVGASESGRA